MKKILSFLAKKPLALAAVALFSMSSYAEDVANPTVEGGTTDKKPTTAIWQKVGENNPLNYFDMVTVVDEKRNKVYADDGTNQIAAVKFRELDEEGNPVQGSGTVIPEGASYFFVAEGAPHAEAFSLNKSLTKDKDGNYLNSADEVVDPEDEDLVIIEDSMVPLSADIEVEKAGHKMMGGWWLIILAIVCVAGITAYTHRE